MPPHRLRRALALLAVLAAAGCAERPGHGGHAWDGRRGYDGRGDYGYDPEASRAEARAYRATAARASYPAPGPAGDPWGPHVREAAARFGVPERWIREVMRQESGGRTTGADGLPITSSAGAMGLMQIMPATWDYLRRRHGLGTDPFAPRDNILAGAAYIREMHDRFGSPWFLAAYNAGPERTAAYLAGAAELPGETVNYLASVAPRLGREAPGGPARVMLATARGAALPAPRAAVADPSDLAYAGGGLVGGEYTAAGAAAADAGDPSLRAYAGGGLRGADYARAVTSNLAPEVDDPSLRAFDGGGLVTRAAPTGALTGGARRWW